MFLAGFFPRVAPFPGVGDAPPVARAGNVGAPALEVHSPALIFATHAAYLARRGHVLPPCDGSLKSGTARRFDTERLMAWIMLFFAGILEIVWATAMKLSDGFTRPLASAITAIAMIGSFALLSLAMRQLPLGTAYMIWTGIGAIGAFVVGIVMLGEGVSAARIAAAALIVSGMALMKWAF